MKNSGTLRAFNLTNPGATQEVQLLLQVQGRPFNDSLQCLSHFNSFWQNKMALLLNSSVFWAFTVSCHALFCCDCELV